MTHTINRTPDEYFDLTKGYLTQLSGLRGDTMGYGTVLLGALRTVRKGLTAMEQQDLMQNPMYANMCTQQVQLLQKGVDFMPRFAAEASPENVLELGCELFAAVRGQDQVAEFLRAQMTAGAVLAKRKLTTDAPASRQMGTLETPSVVITLPGPLGIKKEAGLNL